MPPIRAHKPRTRQGPDPGRARRRGRGLPCLLPGARRCELVVSGARGGGEAGARFTSS